MQFRDLKAQYAALKNDIDQAMLDVAASSAFIMGKPVKELEAQLAEYVGVKHCLGCANGTEALTLALKALAIKPGEAVFVPDFTFFASAEVISLEGATPVFVDVDKETFNMDAADLERAVKAVLKEGRLQPKAVITVDLFGQPADYPAIRAVADAYGLLIVEDGAQGFGGEINAKKACSFGDISTTSFFPAKPLGCYGDGGAVFTDNDEWAALVESYRVHGKGSFKYDNVRIGINSRLDTLQAAILLPKLKAFKEYELADVNKAAAYYTEKLISMGLAHSGSCCDTAAALIMTPVVPQGFLSSWAQYTIRLADKAQRDGLQAALKEKGIPSMVYYPQPMHLQTAYKGLNYPMGSCPRTVHLCQTVLSLPMHPYLTKEDADTVCEAIGAYFA